MLAGDAPHPDSVSITNIGFGVAAADRVGVDDAGSVGAATDVQLARARMATRAALEVFMGSPFGEQTIERRKTFTRVRRSPRDAPLALTIGLTEGHWRHERRV